MRTNADFETKNKKKNQEEASTSKKIIDISSDSEATDTADEAIECILRQKFVKIATKKYKRYKSQFGENLTYEILQFNTIELVESKEPTSKLDVNVDMEFGGEQEDVIVDDQIEEPMEIDDSASAADLRKLADALIDYFNNR